MSEFRQMLVIRKSKLRVQRQSNASVTVEPSEGYNFIFLNIFQCPVTCTGSHHKAKTGQNRPKQAKTHGNVLLPFNRNCVFSGELIVSKIQGKCDVSIGIPLVFGKFWQLQSEILHNRFVTRLYSRLLQANKSLILR